MANTAQLNTDVGAKHGSTSVCQHCGGELEMQDGTDPDQVYKLDGFVDDYQCKSCGGNGRYKENIHGDNSFVGVCAESYL